jgi:hypothetical protein
MHFVRTAGCSLSDCKGIEKLWKNYKFHKYQRIGNSTKTCKECFNGILKKALKYQSKNKGSSRRFLKQLKDSVLVGL